MFVLEYAELYIIKEPLTKNRCHQTTRWKQLYACEDREPLQAILDEKKDKKRYRIIGAAALAEKGESNA
jgi:hypothetical protein